MSKVEQFSPFSASSTGYRFNGVIVGSNVVTTSSVHSPCYPGDVSGTWLTWYPRPSPVGGHIMTNGQPVRTTTLAGYQVGNLREYQHSYMVFLLFAQGSTILDGRNISPRAPRPENSRRETFNVGCAVWVWLLLHLSNSLATRDVLIPLTATYTLDLPWCMSQRKPRQAPAVFFLDSL